MADDDIATQLALPIEKIQQIGDLVRQTVHMRSPSQTLTWDKE